MAESQSKGDNNPEGSRKPHSVDPDDTDLYRRMYFMSMERWHGTCDEVIECIAGGGSLADVVSVVARWLDGSDAIDEKVVERIAAAYQRAGGAS